MGNNKENKENEERKKETKISNFEWYHLYEKKTTNNKRKLVRN